MPVLVVRDRFGVTRTVGVVAGLAVCLAVSGCARTVPLRTTVTSSPAPEAPTTTSTTEAPLQDPAAAFGLPASATLVADAQAPAVSVYPAPFAKAASVALPNPNNLGAPLVFRVVAVKGDWLQVMLPMRPNGSAGWIRSSDVHVFNDAFKVAVHLAAHTLLVFKDNQQVEAHPIISGAPSAPTPTGDFYVTELLKAANPTGAYGPYAFGLSGFSDTYSEFEGGPGQIAIHGTNQPYLMGTSASHGCVRVTDDVIAHLAAVLPTGTPVVITQ